MCQTRLKRLLSSSLTATLLVTACGALSLEEQLLQRFFEASRLYDAAALEKVAAPGLAFNPVTEGVVEEFELEDILHEGDRRTLMVKARVRTRTGTRTEKMTLVIERSDDQWRITEVRPLRVSRTSP